jgi:hypothetical protein
MTELSNVRDRNILFWGVLNKIQSNKICIVGAVFSVSNTKNEFSKNQFK